MITKFNICRKVLLACAFVLLAKKVSLGEIFGY